MSQDPPRMIPSGADAPTLALACATLLASVYPQQRTPDEQHELAVQTVDAVFAIWEEIARRIAAQALVKPAESGGEV